MTSRPFTRQSTVAELATTAPGRAFKAMILRQLPPTQTEKERRELEEMTLDFPLETLATNVDMTVTAEFANGKVYTLSGAWLSNDATVKADEGECELEFTGTRGVWL